MQRPLQQSLRRLYRQRCYQRIYSTQAATMQQHPAVLSSDSGASTSAAHKVADGPNSPASADEKEKRKSRPVQRSSNLPFLPDINDWQAAPNKVDIYLAALRAGGVEPTLKDLFRLTPKKIPSTKRRDYSASFIDLRDRLCRTFSKEQLRRFCRELKLDPRYSHSSRKKTEYAEAIMEKYWGWEDVKEVEKRKRDASEVVKKSFPVSASELFLLLGKDGSELLQISRDYNVHISVAPNPLCIRIEGFKSSVRKLEEMIAERKKKIIDEKVDLPTGEPLSPSLLQQVSRTANAFIQNISDSGKIRITANDRKRLEAAKRIAVRAAVQIRHSARTPFAALVPPPPSALAISESPPTYALYPFSSQRSLPWTNATGLTFRSRRVNDWLIDRGRQASFSADLSGRKGQLVSINGETSSLEVVMSRAFGDSTSSYSFSASTGHVLVMSTSQEQQTSILPPLSGSWQYRELLDWMKEGNANRVYVPCLPSPLHSAPPTQERIVHRLTYRHVRNNTDSPSREETEYNPTKIIRAEVVINRQKLEDSESTATESIQPLNIDGDEVVSELDELLLDDPASPEHVSEASAREELQSSEQAGKADTVQGNVSEPRSEPEALNADLTSSQSKGSEETEASSDVKKHSETLEHDGSPGSEKGKQNTSALGNNEPMCYKGKELELLIALPDRPMDMKFTALGSKETTLIRDISELNEYFEALRTYLDNTATEWSPPEPPLYIKDGEEQYILDLNASIRQSTETLDVGNDSSQDLDSPSLDGLGSHRISTTTESIYDLESGQKFVNCEITCNGNPADGSWITFLEDIDLITSLGFKTKQAPSGGNLFSLDDQSSDENIQL